MGTRNGSDGQVVAVPGWLGALQPAPSRLGRVRIALLLMKALNEREQATEAYDAAETLAAVGSP
jgi:hypothetical protein